jgi:hypothetical protein
VVVRVVLDLSSNSSTLAVSSPVSNLSSLELLEVGSSAAGVSSTTEEDLL